MTEYVSGIIKPALLILIPFTWVVGMQLKKCLSYEGDGKFMCLMRKIVRDTGRLKVLIHVIIILAAIAIGLVTSDMDGARRIADAVVIYGLHGVVCVWLASRLYDKVREQ